MIAVGTSAATTRQFTLPSSWCLIVPISAVGTITASEVPMAGLMSSFSSHIMAGTITTPPPTPNNPLVTPPMSPIRAALRYDMAAFMPEARTPDNTFPGRRRPAPRRVGRT